MPREQLPRNLELLRGDAVLGTIEVSASHADFPWYSGKFVAAPAFEAVRPLFERELKLIRANTTDDSEQWDDWEVVHAELHEPGVRLVAPAEGYEADDILIHITGTEAWWREEE